MFQARLPEASRYNVSLLAQCSELLPSPGRQCFYDGDILQQFLRQTNPSFK
jgi:hypothetical protein